MKEAISKRLSFNSVSPSHSIISRTSTHTVSTIPPTGVVTNHSEPDSKVQVCLRIKPCPNVVETISVLDETRVRAKLLPTSTKSTDYSFSRVLAPDATQKEVFESVAGNLIANFLIHGKDGLIFAYGVTNSGKTFTVEGTQEHPGIIPQTLERIFSSKGTQSPTVFISYLQIYNDQVHDLQDPLPPSAVLDPFARKNLKVKLREDQVIVEGLKETKITTLKEGMNILERGRENRTTVDNRINQTSSRSHTVFIVRVGKARLHIVDLAGSERGKRTKATGARQIEASNINLSLSQLMQCLDAMRANQKLSRLYPDKPRDKPPFRPIPFRDCKLTMLFRDCLKGKNCAGVVMIVNASPDPIDFEETSQALRYGELTRSTTIESNASNNLLSMAAAVAAGRYDYNGRLIREPLAGVVEEKGKQEDMKPTASPSNLIKQLVVLSPPELSAFHENHFSSPGAVRLANSLNEGNGRDQDEEIESLRAQLAEARGKLVTMEMELREELSNEMTERLKEMDERYNSKSRPSYGDELSHGRKSTSFSSEDVKILAEQVDECEQEMARMREKHARDIEALQTELNNAKRATIEATTHTANQVTKQVVSTPWMVAEERRKVDRLLRELEDEKEAHRQIILEQAELQDLVEQGKEKEITMNQQLVKLKEENDMLRNRLVTEERTVLFLKSKMIVSSPKCTSAQLSGMAPGSLLSKRKNKENEIGIVN